MGHLWFDHKHYQLLLSCWSDLFSIVSIYRSDLNTGTVPGNLCTTLQWVQFSSSPISLLSMEMSMLLTFCTALQFLRCGCFSQNGEWIQWGLEWSWLCTFMYCLLSSSLWCFWTLYSFSFYWWSKSQQKKAIIFKLNQDWQHTVSCQCFSSDHTVWPDYYYYFLIIVFLWTFLYLCIHSLWKSESLGIWFVLFLCLAAWCLV